LEKHTKCSGPVNTFRHFFWHGPALVRLRYDRRNNFEIGW
jgi:hypothetical protein